MYKQPSFKFFFLWVSDGQYGFGVNGVEFHNSPLGVHRFNY